MEDLGVLIVIEVALEKLMQAPDRLRMLLRGGEIRKSFFVKRSAVTSKQEGKTMDLLSNCFEFVILILPSSEQPNPSSSPADGLTWY